MRVAAFLAICMAFPVLCIARTSWLVPDDFGSIQGALADPSVVDGDTVIVRPGTYVENIDFLGKGITLKSEQGPDYTVIDGNTAGPVVTFQSMEGPDTVLDGFTLSKGTAGYGGGILCKNASPTITNNTITMNMALHWGGGIYCEESDPFIVNNLLTGNISKQYGGGIFCYESSPMITNNTITANLALYGGGGIYSANYSGPVVMNSILWDNETSLGPGPEIFIGDSATPAILAINNSDVKGGQGLVILFPQCMILWGGGMRDEDPLFVDPGAGDFHLRYTSPCKDTGSNSAPMMLTDCEGDPRIAYGTVDMGSDEFHPHLYHTGDATPGGNIELKFIGLPGDLINGLVIGIHIFDPPLPCDYGLWYMDHPMQIMHGFGTLPAEGVSVFPGTLSATPAPYTVYLQAAIDSWLTNLCTLHVQ